VVAADAWIGDATLRRNRKPRGGGSQRLPHKLAPPSALELPREDGLAHERRAQFRDRNESPARQASVQAFAAPRDNPSMENT
jgi:hypothetical protein